MISIFILSVLSQKTLQEILILNTDANYFKKFKNLAFKPHPQSSGKHRLSDFCSLLSLFFLKTKGQSKPAGGYHTNGNHKLIKLSNNVIKKQKIDS